MAVVVVQQFRILFLLQGPPHVAIEVSYSALLMVVVVRMGSLVVQQTVLVVLLQMPMEEVMRMELLLALVHLLEHKDSSWL